MADKYITSSQYEKGIGKMKEYIDKSIPHIKTQELITIPADTVLEIFYSDNHMMEFDKPSNINLDYDFIVNYNNEEIDCTTGEDETGKYIECFNDNTILLKFYPGVGINGNANETKMVLAIELLNTDIIVTDIVLKQVKAKYLNNKYLKRDVAIKNSITIGTRLFGNSIGQYSFSNGAYNIASGDNSHAEGHRSKALYLFSHAEGNNTTASGESSHAEGNNSKASGESSHAEGSNTTASGNKSHAEGNGTRASAFSSHAEGNSTKASGYCSHAEGYTTTAEGQYSHAEGSDTTVSGSYSHAEGYNTKVSGDCSHVEGNSTTASGNSSHAEGYYTIAKGQNQHVQGKYNIEDTANKYAHIVGNGSAYNIRSNAHTLDWSGNAWYAGDVQANNVPHVVSEKVVLTVPAATITEKKTEIANANIGNSVQIPVDGTVEYDPTKLYYLKYNNKEYSAAHGDTGFIIMGDDCKCGILNREGKTQLMIATLDTTNITDLQLIEKDVKKLDNIYLPNDLNINNSITVGIRTGEIGRFSSSFGADCEASGDFSHAEGSETIASSENSHAEGIGVNALGYASHAEGYRTTASGDSSHAEGSETIASGVTSHTEGQQTTASGNFSHAEGASTTASGNWSHAEGSETTASGDFSHAEGASTTASGNFQHVQGKYNIEDTKNKYAHIVGNGSENKKSNAHTLDWSGNAWYAGKLSQEGTPTEDKDLTTKKYVDANNITDAEIDAVFNELSMRPIKRYKINYDYDKSACVVYPTPSYMYENDEVSITVAYPEGYSLQAIIVMQGKNNITNNVVNSDRNLITLKSINDDINVKIVLKENGPS